jgi:RNA polymerase sigma-54 factor
MKQTLQLRIGQHLTMTPQLQQAIRLLQLSTLDLQQEVQEALDSNLMLETEEEGLLRDPPEVADFPLSDTDHSAATPPDHETADREIDPEQIPLSEESSVDTDWDELYDGHVPSGNGNLREEYDGDFLAQKSQAATLHDHLAWQLNLAGFSEIDRAIALAVVDAINEDGYLTCALEEIHEGLRDAAIDLDEVVAVLHRIQSFDPAGVAARDLRECLLLQLRQLPVNTLGRQAALTVCQEHFALLAAQDYGALKRRVQLNDTDVQAVMRLLRSLHPRPGAQIARSAPQYVIPDIIVTRRRGNWHVELNPETTPRLRVNPDYAKLIRRADQSDDNVCLKNHLQEARWFLKSLASRNETVLRVATKIVELQRGFFEYGHEAMRPLVLRDVADALEMHESTVSRVTSQKYMHTPRGTFELKFFFSSHVGTSSGGECSATAIRALIKKLIAAESPKAPLSDLKLAKILAEQGIEVARRTVAKYRESMGIRPSVERKRLL